MKDEKSEIAGTLTEIGVNQIEFHDPRLFRDLLGQHDQHIKILQNTLQLKVRARGATLEIEGDPLQVELGSQIMHQLYSLLEKGYPVYASDVDYAIRILSGDSRARLQDIFLDTIYISAHKRTITPKSIAQKAYIDAIRRYFNDSGFILVDTPIFTTIVGEDQTSLFEVDYFGRPATPAPSAGAQ